MYSDFLTDALNVLINLKHGTFYRLRVNFKSPVLGI